MVALVEALNAEFGKFAPDYINDPKKAVYRIYRDIRFSSDKSPYKTHLAAVFPRRGGDRGSSPGFYFPVSAKGIGGAGGVYEPAPPPLVAIPTWLAGNHKKIPAAPRVGGRPVGRVYSHTPIEVSKRL